MKDDDLPEFDKDLCCGCAECATGCPEDAIVIESKPGFPVLPRNGKAQGAAIKAAGK